jgi:hypothetical protein
MEVPRSVPSSISAIEVENKISFHTHKMGMRRCRLMVPVEVVEAAELERGELMKVRIQVDEQGPA